MPINIGPENAAFNVKIPEFNENADIQTAFRLYHYGENSQGTGTLNQQSLAGYLDALENSKISKTPTLIPLNANLNDITESGFYVQTTNVRARTGINYPKIPPIPEGLEFAGILRVINDGNNNIYQEYHIGGIPDQSVYWRVRFGSLSFSQWQGFAKEGHIHDDLYYRKGESDTRYFGEIRFKTVRLRAMSANNYTLVKEDEDTVILINNGSVPNNVRIPADVSDPTLNIAVGTTIRVIQTNTGQTSIIPNTSTVIVNSTPGNKLRAIWSVAYLTKIATNNWVVSGDLQDSRTRIQRRADLGIYVQEAEPTGSIQNGDLWFW